MNMKQKNLLYIFADQWRAHGIGAAGEDPVATPNMDRFAAESMSCTNAISTYPLCSPHRAALLTGKYPLSCGMWTNCKIGLDEVLMLKPQEITISDVLHDAGYETAYIGKWHLDGSEKNFYDEPVSGAVNWDAYTPPGERRHHFDYWISYGAMDNHLNPHYWRDTPDKIKPGQWSPEYETDMTLDYLEHRDREKPFCLFVSWNPPHPPYDQVPDKYMKMYEGRELPFRPNVPAIWRQDAEYLKKRQEYFAAISGLDENFGRLMQYLKEHGLYEDTLIVLSADHGDCMGSHGVYGKNIWYEESIRIPLYFHRSDIPAGKSDVLFASPDHMPTLLELLEIPVPETVEGQALGRFLLGGHKEESGSLNEPEHAFLCMFPGMPELVNPYRRLGMNPKSFGWRGIRTKTVTYILDRGTIPGAEPKRLIYHNDTDPYQLTPQQLRSDSPEARRYEGMLIEYLEKLNDPFLRIDMSVDMDRH